MTDLPAGRELDALIAEKVMGVECEWQSGPSGQRYALTKEPYPTEYGRYERVPVPAYSTDIAAAWLMVEKWQGDFDLRRQNGMYWAELFQPSREWAAWAETAPLAICRVALTAARENALA